MKRNDTIKWINTVMKNKIFIDKEILNYEEPITGIYGIFVKNDTEEICAYIGRSVNIYSRMFIGKDAHFVKLRKENSGISLLTNAMQNKNDTIIAKVLEKVEFQYDTYNQDMQRLASKECYFIDKYQSLNQCLEQLPDGSNMKKSYWKNEYQRKKLK